MCSNEPTHSPSSWHSRPLGRLAIAGVLLLVEYLALTVVFDAKYVAARGGVWAGLGFAGNFGSLLIVATTAFLLLPRLPNASATQASVGRPNIWMLLAHALLALAFVWITQRAFSGKDAPPGPAVAWILTWAIVGVATALSLLLAVLVNWHSLVQTLVRVAAAGSALGLLGWVAGAASTSLWRPLSRITFLTTAALLEFLKLDVEIDPDALAIDVEGFAVEISAPCSGFEGIGMYVVLMSGFLFQHRARFRFPRALVLLPLGMALVWLGNAVRIAALMLVGARIDPEIALGSFHSKAGWVLFAAITIAIAVIARKASFLGTAEEPQRDVLPYVSAAPLLVPLLTWVGVGFVTSMFSGHHDPLYALRVVGAFGALWAYRDRIRGWFQAPTPLAIALGLCVGVIWLSVPIAAEIDGSKRYLVSTLGVLGYSGWITLRCLGGIVVVPICEELAFRGYLARRLTQAEFWNVPFTKLSLLGIAGSAIAFGAVHERWALGTLAGFVYAWLVRRSGRLADGIAAHALTNAVIAVWVLTTGNWSHW